MNAAGGVPVREGEVLAGKYLVERVIGAGGMGVVVAARHQLLGGRVALKFLLPGLMASDDVVPRFLKEAQAATRIKSEHVARVTDLGMLDNGSPYMVMEYLEGEDLARLLARRGPLPVAEAVDYVMQALQAIAEAHAQGIVHRDLKPSNLFMTRRSDGTPLIKVLDFGIAKALLPDTLPAGQEPNATGTFGLLGSPLYMSPEQIRSSKRVDARSDVWSAGVVLHELLSARYPFNGENASAVLASIVADPPLRLRSQRPELPEVVERIVLSCLVKDRERRVQSVAELAELLAPLGTDDARLSLSRVRGVTGRAAPAPSDPPVHVHSQDALAQTEKHRTDSNFGGTQRAAPVKGGRRGPLTLALVSFGLVLALLVGIVSLSQSSAPTTPSAAVAVQVPQVTASALPAPATPPVAPSAVAAPHASTSAPSAPLAAEVAPVTKPRAQQAPAKALSSPQPVRAATSAVASAQAPPAKKPTAAKGDVRALIDGRR